MTKAFINLLEEDEIQKARRLANESRKQEQTDPTAKLGVPAFGQGAQPQFQPQATETYDTSPFDQILAPQRDVEKEGRLKKVAAVNSIGDALRVVVQAMGAAKGANVTPLNTTQTTEKSLNHLQFLDDQFKNEQQRYDNMKYQDQLNKFTLKQKEQQLSEEREIQATEKQADRDLRRDIAEANITGRMQTTEMRTQAQRDVAATRGSAGNNRVPIEEFERREQIKADERIRVEEVRAKYKQAQSKDPDFVLYDNERNKATAMNKDEAFALYDIILSEAVNSGVNISTFEKESIKTQDDLLKFINRYWKRIDKARQFVEAIPYQSEGKGEAPKAESFDEWLQQQ